MLDPWVTCFDERYMKTSYEKERKKKWRMTELKSYMMMIFQMFIEISMRI